MLHVLPGQYGVDVQQTNAQGHTALEIVNMYADPRTASVMKQVLQGQCPLTHAALEGLCVCVRIVMCLSLSRCSGAAGQDQDCPASFRPAGSTHFHPPYSTHCSPPALRVQLLLSPWKYPAGGPGMRCDVQCCTCIYVFTER